MGGNTENTRVLRRFKFRRLVCKTKDKKNIYI